MRTRTLLMGGLAVSFVAVSALAQTSVDRSFKTTSNDCSAVVWSDAALKAYPTIASACQAVEERDGKKYVKFEGRVARNINRGEQLAINFKDASEMTVTPPANTVLYVNGRKTPVSQLQRGDELKFYVPEDRLAAQFHEDNTPQTQYVVVPIVYREIIREEVPERTASLPSTASELPLVALSGMLLLGLGAGLSLYRLRRR